MPMSFRKILVATDFSVSAERAVETAVALATCSGAELVIEHVIEESARTFPFSTRKGVREAARGRLDDAVGALRSRLLEVTGVLREGIAWEGICSAASELAADLIVMGSQGRRGLPRFVLGSVAERVVRFSSVPVLTVHSTDCIAVLAGGMDRFRHILAPTDFSDSSQWGIDTAVSLALDLEASLTLVHVYEPASYTYYAIDPAIVAEVEAEARGQLDGVLARVRGRCPKAEGVLCTGAAWEGILDAAKECGADLVVLSTHGRRGLSRALLGSVTEKIVRLAPVPVLTVGSKG